MAALAKPASFRCGRAVAPPLPAPPGAVRGRPVLGGEGRRSCRRHSPHPDHVSSAQEAAIGQEELQEEGRHFAVCTQNIHKRRTKRAGT